MKPLTFGGMDVARTPRRMLPHNVAIAAIVVVVVLSGAIGIGSLVRGNGGAVSVERATVVTDVVQQGTLQRTIDATGTLVPQEVHIVAAIEPGVVEFVDVKPGQWVAKSSSIARTSNPDLDAAVVAASSAIDVARAQLRSAQAQAQAAVLAQQSTYATALAQSRVDRTNFVSLRGLHDSGFVADQTYEIAAIKAKESSSQAQVAQAEIGVSQSQQAANVAAAQAQLEQASAQLAAKQTLRDALTVRANTQGIVQSVAIDPGTRVDAGTELARIANICDLKAILQVPEGQVPQIAIGMPVTVTAGNRGMIGHVSRIAPAAQNGTVAVDVAFGPSSQSNVRPDQNVDGSIDLGSLRNVISIARPAGAADDSTVELYRLDPQSGIARRVSVRLGRGSADRIEVLSGLQPGDTVIVSDTSAYNGTPALHLH